MKYFGVIFLLSFIIIFTGCQKKVIAPIQHAQPKLTLQSKFLVMNTQSLDNKQNITEDELFEALLHLFKEALGAFDYEEKKVHTKIEVLDNQYFITYYLNNKEQTTYQFNYKLHSSTNAHTLHFTNFKQSQQIKNDDLQTLVHEHFVSFYKKLDKFYFTKKRVYIYVNDIETLVPNYRLLKRFNTHFKPYQPKRYAQIFLIPFEDKSFPTYIDFRNPNAIHTRTYIPYELNTKSGSTLSSYKLQLFYQKLKNIVTQ